MDKELGVPHSDLMKLKAMAEGKEPPEGAELYAINTMAHALERVVDRLDKMNEAFHAFDLRLSHIEAIGLKPELDRLEARIQVLELANASGSGERKTMGTVVKAGWAAIGAAFLAAANAVFPHIGWK